MINAALQQHIFAPGKMLEDRIRRTAWNAR
jgi:hypothetical protein